MTRSLATRTRSIRRSLPIALVLTVVACGSSDPSSDDATTVATTAAEATTATSPSASPATTTTSADSEPAESTTPATKKPRKKPKPATTTSTYPPPPTSVALPTPIAAPLDDEAPEPVVPIGSIQIPRIGLDTTVYEGIRLPTFDLGPGHWPGSAMPGKVGNMILGGHRTEGNADFGALDQLQPGDEMIVTANGAAPARYLVDSTEITDPFALRIINQTPMKTATLFACHPPGSVRQRIVVHLTLAP